MRKIRVIALFATLFVFGAAFAVDYEAIEKLTPAERIDAYSKLLGVERDSAEILFKLGNAYFDADMSAEAIASYRRSLAAGGDFPVFLNLTYVLEEVGRRPEAEAAFEERVRQTPKDAVLFAFYGDFLSGGEEEEKAVASAMEAYRRALGIDDKCVEAHFGLGSLFARTGLYREAVREWERILSIDSKHRLAPEARRNIDRVHREQGR